MLVREYTNRRAAIVKAAKGAVTVCDCALDGASRKILREVDVP